MFRGREKSERGRGANADAGAARDHFGAIKWDHLISSDISSEGMSSPSAGLTDNRPHCEAATQTTSFVCTPLFSGRRPRVACRLPDKASPKQLLIQIFLGQGQQKMVL